MTGNQLAKALEITPEWLSKIYTKKAEGSSDLGLRLDAVLRREGIEPGFIGIESSSNHLREDQAGYGPREAIERDIDIIVAGAKAAAGRDLGRLGWIREQLLRHLAIPEHWDDNVKSQGAAAVSAVYRAAGPQTPGKPPTSNR